MIRARVECRGDADDIRSRTTIDRDIRVEGGVQSVDGQRIIIVAEIDRQRIGRIWNDGVLKGRPNNLNASGSGIVLQSRINVIDARVQIENCVGGIAGVDRLKSRKDNAPRNRAIVELNAAVVASTRPHRV